MTKERISVPEASRVLGISQPNLRKMLRKKQLPYGKATKIGEKADGTPKFRYDIYLQPLLKYTGMETWPEEGVRNVS